jgi:hypothetical protein
VIRLFRGRHILALAEYRGDLTIGTYPFHDCDIFVTGCGRLCGIARGFTSRRSLPAKLLESRKSTRAFGS